MTCYNVIWTTTFKMKIFLGLFVTRAHNLTVTVKQNNIRFKFTLCNIEAIKSYQVADFTWQVLAGWNCPHSIAGLILAIYFLLFLFSPTRLQSLLHILHCIYMVVCVRALCLTNACQFVDQFFSFLAMSL